MKSFKVRIKCVSLGRNKISFSVSKVGVTSKISIVNISIIKISIETPLLLSRFCFEALEPRASTGDLCFHPDIINRISFQENKFY